MIPSLNRELDPKEAEFHTPWTWNPIVLMYEPASPRSLATLPEDFTSKLELKPTFSSHIVRTPDNYGPVTCPRQTTEPGRITSSTVSSSSVSISPPSPSVPFHSTSGEYFPSPLMIPRSTFIAPPVAPRCSTLNSSSESPRLPIAPFMPPSPIPPETSALRKPHPLQNSYPATAMRSLDTIHEVATSSSSNSTPRQQPIKLAVFTGSVRRGYWNRRGDHLTPEGYLVFPPKSMQYPDDLKMYPFRE